MTKNCTENTSHTRAVYILAIIYDKPDALNKLLGHMHSRDEVSDAREDPEWDTGPKVGSGFWHGPNADTDAFNGQNVIDVDWHGPNVGDVDLH